MDSSPVSDLRLATITTNEQGILVIRFKPLTIDVEGVQEIVRERARLSLPSGKLVLVVLSGQPFAELDVPAKDHLELVKDRTLAEATVAVTDTDERIARIHYEHLPQPFPTAVFREETSAIAWLIAQHSDR